MSVITDIILITSSEDGSERDGENPNADRLGMAICGIPAKECGYDGALGNKAFSPGVFMWSMNYFDTEKMMETFSWIRWDYPEAVYLLIREEEDYKFKMHKVDMEEWKRRGWQ